MLNIKIFRTQSQREEVGAREREESRMNPQGSS